jgi:Cu2+-exporting ATPase
VKILVIIFILISSQAFSDDNKNILFSIEKYSEHPLANSIVNYIKDSSPKFLDSLTVENIAGLGIKGIYKSTEYFIGNEIFISQHLTNITDEQQNFIDEQLKKSFTLVFFASKKELLAVISIYDNIKDGSVQAIKKLKQKNIKIVMLTGDNYKTAELVASKVGIDEFHANVLPTEKAEYIKKIQQNKNIVAMVGDGINDSAALAQADIGISIGKSSDIAMEVANVTIISPDLRKILNLRKISKLTSKTIKQNLFWAFFYNVIAIPIAAGCLFPFYGFLFNPMWAGAAMAFSSISVVANSLLMKRKKC